MQHAAQAGIAKRLPASLLQCMLVVGQPTAGRQDQRPGQLGRRHRRADAFGHRHTQRSARRNIHMRTHAPGLADQFQPWQPLQQRRIHPRAFADQHQRVGVGQACGARIELRIQRAQHLHLVVLQLLQAGQLRNGALVVVGHHNAHQRGLIGEGNG